MTQQATIFYISNVPAEDSPGGSAVIHRHLEAARKRFSVEVLLPPVPLISVWGVCRRIAALLGRLGYRRCAECLHVWIHGRWADGWVRRRLRGRKKTVVLTVAHGDLAYAAARGARKAGLGLVTIFHDWWPDIPDHFDGTRQRAERYFLQQYRQSNVSLPVSEGMRAALGPHAQADVLYPIPADADAVSSTNCDMAHSPFRVLYSGNLREYGSMIADALRESLLYPGIRLEVRGRNPSWPTQFGEQMRARGLWLDFASVRQLAEWFDTADAFLVATEFDDKLRRRMETSFPSKLTEFSSYGRPLIIWGPEYSSAVRWARQTDAGLVFTSRDAASLIEFLQTVASRPGYLEDYGRRAQVAYETNFAPTLLQVQFERAIDSALMTRYHEDLAPD